MSNKGKEKIVAFSNPNIKPEALDLDSKLGEKQLIELDYKTWLPFSAKLYNISPRPEDYVVVNVPILPSDLPNRNGVAFPLQELVKFLPPPTNRQSYKSWVGCPMHYEHRNEVHEDAYGVIFDSVLRKMKGFGNGNIWQVYLLMGVDKTKHPEMAQRVLTGDIQTYSMGAVADYFTCSVSGQVISKNQRSPYSSAPFDGVEFSRIIDPMTMEPRLVYRNAHNISGIECSLVEDPAWASASSDVVLGLHQ